MPRTWGLLEGAARARSFILPHPYEAERRPETVREPEVQDETLPAPSEPVPRAENGPEDGPRRDLAPPGLSAEDVARGWPSFREPRRRRGRITGRW